MMNKNSLPTIPGDTDENTILVVEELNANQPATFFATAPYLSVSTGDIVSFGSEKYAIVQDVLLDVSGDIRRFIIGAASVYRIDDTYYKVKKGCSANGNS